MDIVLPSLLLQLVLVGTNAFFAMSEFAVVSINTQKMKRLADHGNKAAKRLLIITDAPSDFLATIQVGVTLSGFLASASAADSFADPILKLLAFVPVPAASLRSVVVIAITLILAYFMLVLGELAPKRIAMKDADGVALKVVGIIWVLNKICRPVIRFIAASTNLVLKPFGIGPDSSDEPVAEEDILMMVEAGEEGGTVLQAEHAMIKNVFAFDDRKVTEVMTHRTDVIGVPTSGTLADIVTLQKDSRFARLPVYQDNLDNIVGAVFVKDIISVLSPTTHAQERPAQYMRSVLYVPESITCSAMLRAFQKEKVHLAVVVDEYGGTEGIVTMEDLLETIVGRLDEEHTDVNDVIVLEDGVYDVGGDVPVNELEGLLDENILDNLESDTLGGLITEMLGRIPAVGESLLLEEMGYKLTVMSATPRAVTRVKVEKIGIKNSHTEEKKS